MKQYDIIEKFLNIDTDFEKHVVPAVYASILAMGILIVEGATIPFIMIFTMFVVFMLKLFGWMLNT